MSLRVGGVTCLIWKSPSRVRHTRNDNPKRVFSIPLTQRHTPLHAHAYYVQALSLFFLTDGSMHFYCSLYCCWGRANAPSRVVKILKHLIERGFR